MFDQPKRLWIDGHTHLNLHHEDATPCAFSTADVVEVLDRCDADLRLFCEVGIAEMHCVAEDLDALHWANETLYQSIQPAEGRLFGCCFIHPDALAQSHKDLDYYVGERGFVQVGEVEGILGFAMDSPAMIELARHATQLGVPLQMHCSTNAMPTGEHTRQALSLARQVPEAKIIIAHAIGGRNTYQHILAAETYLADAGDNVYLEIFDFHVREYVRAAHGRLGADRLLVGTDWMTYGNPPFATYGAVWQMLYPERNDWSHLQGFGLSRWGNKVWLDSQYVLALDENPFPVRVDSLVGFLHESGLNDDEIAKVGSGNAIRLFGLEDRLGL